MLDNKEVKTFADIEQGIGQLKGEIESLGLAVKVFRDQFQVIGIVAKLGLKSGKAREREQFIRACQPLIGVGENLITTLTLSAKQMAEATETLKSLDFKAMEKVLDFAEGLTEKEKKKPGD